MVARYHRQLAALRYPHQATFDCDDAQQCRWLIVWLELTKIRQWTEEQRTALKDVEHPSWDAALHRYLSSLSPPPVGVGGVSGSLESASAPPPVSLPRVVDALLRRAIEAEFADQSAAINAAAQQRLSGAASRQRGGTSGGRGGVSYSAADAPPIDCSDEVGLRSAAKAVCAQLQLPDPDRLPSPPSTISLLHSLHALLDAHMSMAAAPAAPAAAAVASPAASRATVPSPASSSPSSSSSRASALLFLRSLPLGLDVGDEAVNDLGRGLRVLSGREMKAVQERVTHCMHLAQMEGKRSMGKSMVGRVDMSRGQVGR